MRNIVKFLTDLVFPIMAYGAMFLFGFNFLYSIYSTGHADSDQVKELLGMIVLIVGHGISKNSSNKKYDDDDTKK